MSNLPSLLLQPNSCGTSNPIQSLTKNIHSNGSNYNDRFQSTSSSFPQQQQQHQQTDPFINLQLTQEQQQQQQHSNQRSIENICLNLNRIQLARQPNLPPNNWSTHFLNSVPIQSVLPPHHSKSAVHSNHWQSEFSGSLQPAANHHQPPISKFEHPHLLIQHLPLIPAAISLPHRIPHPAQSHPLHAIHSTRNSTNWDSAFSKYALENENEGLSTGVETVQQLDHDHEATHKQYLVGSHSPTRSTSPDALARIAASLIATVEKNEQKSKGLAANNQQIQPFETNNPETNSSASERLIQSSFIDFMRKLRDGELKVEGDKIVQQHVPVTVQNSTTDPIINHDLTGKTRPLDQQQSPHESSASHYRQGNQPFGMANDPSTRPDDLAKSCSRSTIERTVSPTVSGHLTHQNLIAAYRHELESRMKEMNEIMQETDQELAHAQYRERMNGFQGDGGEIATSPVDLDEILQAASRVGQPPANQSWTTTEVPGASELWTEEFDPLSSQDEGLDEFFDDMGMFGRPVLPHEIELERLKRAQKVPSSQELEWAKFQDDWESIPYAVDQAQASDQATGQTVNSLPVNLSERIQALRAETGYDFQPVNPNLLEQNNRTRHHSTHQRWDGSSHLEQLYPHDGSVLESVLQKEKEVLASPETASAWFELGVKQQENEREELAIQALKKAIQLDPQLSDAILALAISYANENQKNLAFDMIENWINVQASQVPNYRESLCRNGQDEVDRIANSQQLHGMNHESELRSTEHDNDVKYLRIKHERLTQKLIQLARLGGRVKGSAAVDPDVQMALGVLFNSNDEFQKACDCFAAALAVRPSNPLLFNRLGATLANSGKPEEAIEYYKRAIELLPSYIRARYNLSISLINLGKYFESLKNLINALIIQQQDQDFENSQPHTSSDVLWQTLEINCSLLKNELSSVQTELDECFIHKDLARISKILVNFK